MAKTDDRKSGRQQPLAKNSTLSQQSRASAIATRAWELGKHTPSRLDQLLAERTQKILSAKK